MSSKPTFTSLNLSSPPPSPLPSTFTIAAPPDTDIWKTRRRGSVFTGPVHYLSLPISTFRSARVTISGRLSELYDQGGLLLAFPSSSSSSSSSGGTVPRRWVKLGVERVQSGTTQLSCVACDRFADWSLQLVGDGRVTVEFERKVGDDALWGYWIVEGEERRVVREVTWAFVGEGGDGDAEGDGDVWVGVYAARPAKVASELDISFSDLAVEDENGWIVGEARKVDVN